MRKRGRQQTESGHQSGHDDGTHAQDSAFPNCLIKGSAVAKHLDDFLDHNDAVLNGNAGHGDESDRS